MSLRSGAGLDGLQDVCNTIVFGELDWSPGVHEQCTGRVYRDGQEHGSVAYYLVSEDGSDPIVADVLGLKKQQIEGIKDPDQELVEKLEVDPDHVKKLAKHILDAKGISLESSEDSDAA
jgi:SNF2 family DNA or RNA helicase